MFRRDRRDENPTTLAEIVTPRGNSHGPAAMERALAGLLGEGPVSLEIVATNHARRFFVRAAGVAGARALERQLGAAYPQAEFRPLDPVGHPEQDPARVESAQQRVLLSLRLRQPDYYPIQTFVAKDATTGPRRGEAEEADPLAGVLADLGDLPEGWRAVSQLILRPAPPDWCRGYLPLAQDPRPAPLPRAETRETGIPVSLLAILLTLGALGLVGSSWYRSGDWLHLGLLVAGTLAVVGGAAWLVARLGHKAPIDPRLVREKVEGNAFRTELRLAVIAPADVSLEQLGAGADHLAAAYHPFNRPRANGFVARRVNPDHRDLTCLAPWRSVRSLPLLNTRELSGLWYLPPTIAGPRLVEDAPLRHRLPLPSVVARGCRIGVCAHQGLTPLVCVPDDTLQRHLFLVAKTRRGKSSLLLRLAGYLMEAPRDGRRALILVDPHGDLARAALGVVPRARQGDVISFDAAERHRPIGLNLLDVGLGWERDKAVANALAIFRREFTGSWGSRMEDYFRHALLTLVEANEARVRSEPDGRERQHTLLDVPVLLQEPGFRRLVLERVQDPLVHDWWGRYDRLDHRLQQEVINPVQTKIGRFAGSRAARHIVGQPRSTLDPADWLRSGRIVIVNTAKGIVGDDTAALIGGTLINLVELLVGAQATLRPAERCKVTLLVDELQCTPGANYEALLSEAAKFGLNLVLATQSLAQIDALDRAHERALSPTLFANVDGIFAFQTSDADARILAREMAEEVTPADLLNLPEFRCYAKLFSQGRSHPTFSVHLDPPPASDETLAHHLAARSRERFGRDVAEVTQALQAARAEHQQARARELALSEVTRRAATKAKQRANHATSERGEPENGRPYPASLEERAPWRPDRGSPGGAKGADEDARETRDDDAAR